VPQCLEFGDQALRQILVKLDVHRIGDSATGRSSWADVAANAVAARTSSSHNVGKVSLHELGKNEKWLQDLIAADPSVLGLGDLTLFRKELSQSTGAVWTCYSTIPRPQ
jgi:hypothetical protein